MDSLKLALAIIVVLIPRGSMAEPVERVARATVAHHHQSGVAHTAAVESSENSVTQPSGGEENRGVVAQAAVAVDSAKGVAKPVAAAPERYVPVTRFDPSRNAIQDIGLALTEAQRSNRRVLLDVGGEWCIWCRRMDSTFAKNRDLGALLHSKFVVVKVNYSKENKNEEALSRLPKIPGYPHLFVLSEEGLLLHSQETAELESGKGYDVEKLRTFILEWGHP